MAQNLNAPNSGNGSAGNTAGYCGNETQSTKEPTDRYAEATTQNYIPASVGSGSLTQAGVSSTQTDSSNDEGN
jgi:hypothetical protein